MTALWLGVITACVGAYLLKLAGITIPEAALNNPRVQRIAGLLPVAMLAALVAVQIFDGGGRYHVDWRTVVGVLAGAVALLLRQGFLVVFLVAAVVTALLRLLV